MANKFREKSDDEAKQAQQPQAEPAAEPTEPAEASKPTEEEAKRGRRWRRRGSSDEGEVRRSGWLVKVLGGDVLASQWVRRQIPLLLLCLFYLLLIVAGRYRVERLSREQKASQQRVEHLREHRILLQEQYQQSVKISTIADDLKEVGVGITAGPPYELKR